MTAESRTPEEIEREIERRRSSLNNDLEELQDRFSIDTMVRQLGEQFREHGGDIGRSITAQVKANPIPLALTGIGLAWMMLGDSRSNGAAAGYVRSEDDFRQTRIDHGRSYAPPISRAPVASPTPSWAREEDSTIHRSDPLSHHRGSAAPRVDTGSSTGVSSSVPSEDGADSSDEGRLARARARISEGTENLTDEGRARVIAAREKAIEMRRSAMRSVRGGSTAAADFVRGGSDTAADLYDRQPLVMGALALAVGAALAGALPRTRMEDSVMGEHSDALFREAEAIFEEERAKAGKVVEAVKDEVRDIASETKADLDRGAPGDRTAAQAASDKVKSSAQRVADTARETADSENLGQGKSRP